MDKLKDRNETDNKWIEAVINGLKDTFVFDKAQDVFTNIWARRLKATGKVSEGDLEWIGEGGDSND